MRKYTILILLLITTNIYAARSFSLNLRLTIPTIKEVTLISADTYIGQVIPNYPYKEDPNSTVNNPWRIAEPKEIVLKVRNTSSSWLYVYTDHRNSEYWTPEIESRVEQTTTINGLINPARLNHDNWYMTTVPLRAQVNGTGEWIWILDRQNNQVQPILNEWTYLMDGNLTVALRSCWNLPKVSGEYKGRVYFSLDTQ